MADSLRYSALPFIVLGCVVGCGQSSPPAIRPAATAQPADAVEPPKPPPLKYSLDQYDKLKFGMTEAEIKALLGEPSERPEPTSWRYVEVVGTGVHSFVLDFDDGKLFSKGANGFIVVDVARLTKENIAKVKLDMSEREVVELLGSGHPAESANGSALRYDDGGKSVLIVFSGGRVSQEPKPIGFD